MKVTAIAEINKRLSDASLRALTSGSKEIMERIAELEAQVERVSLELNDLMEQEIAAERERCAQVADSMDGIFGHDAIAATIRARK